MSLAPLRGMWHRLRRTWDLVHRAATNRVVLTAAAFGLGGSLTFYHHGAIFLWLIQPAGGRLSPFGGFPVVNSPVDMLMATIQLAARGGAVLALPVAAISVLTKISPWIPRRTFWFLLAFIPIVELCGVAGALVAYYVILPAGLNFLLSFGDGFAVPVILLNEYIGLATALMLAMAIIFQLPPAMFMLSKYGLVTYPQFRRYRRYFMVAAPIFAGFITPTFDIFNLLMILVPLLAMWELGLFVSWAARPEEGNYLWAKSIASGLRGLWPILAWPYRKARGILTFLYGEFF